MNPTMLEASDDLTNLSHLNEPAGMEYRNIWYMVGETDPPSSTPGNPPTLCAEGDIHIQWNRLDCHESIRSGGFSLCSRYGSSICRKAKIDSGPSSFRYC